MTTKAKKHQATSKRQDLESLCLALRRSWQEGNLAQTAVALGELKRLYPDLLVSTAVQKSEPPPNYYETLKLGTAASQQEIITSFFKQLRLVCRNKGMSHRTRSYVGLLDAAFVLRKPRLRLSHDLAVVSCWLRASSEDTASQAKGPVQQQEQTKNAKTSRRPQVPSGTSELSAQAPLMLKLLEQSGLITKEEIAALNIQIKQSPAADLDILVTQSGFVSNGEMASVKLAEMLINNGQVSLPQIVVALYDERNSGVRMAESLQTRGWLAVRID